MLIAQVARRFVRSDWGGTETVVLETGRRLLAMGHRVEVHCSRALATCDREDVEGLPVRRHAYFYPYFGLSDGARDRLDRKGGNLFSPAMMLALWRLPGLDLVHLHALKRVGGIGRTVARMRGIPYVVSVHGGVYDVPAAEAASMLEPTAGAFEWGKALGWAVGSRRVLDDADAVLCLGPEEAARVRERHPRTRVEVLPNGVDPARFAGGDGAAFRQRHAIPAGAPVVLTVGRIDPQKDQRTAILALAALTATHPEARLVLAGPVTDAAYRERLAADAASAQVAGRVVFAGGLSGTDVADAYRAADAFLLPSRHEPFGIVVLEAWAAGLPVVATRVGGIPSFAEDGRDCLLVEPGDPVAAAEALRTLLRDRGRAAGLASAGRDKALGSYTWDAVTRRLAALYEELVRQRRAR